MIPAKDSVQRKSARPARRYSSSQGSESELSIFGWLGHTRGPRGMRGIRHRVGDCVSCADFNGAVFVIQNHARATAVYRARGGCAIVAIVNLQRVEVGLNFA